MCEAIVWHASHCAFNGPDEGSYVYTSVLCVRKCVSLSNGLYQQEVIPNLFSRSRSLFFAMEPVSWHRGAMVGKASPVEFLPTVQLSVTQVSREGKGGDYSTVCVGHKGHRFVIKQLEKFI